MYFAPYIATDGVHLPTYEDRLSDLVSSYKSIFGQDINLEISSPDYQLLSIFARAMDDLSQLLLYDFVSRNPQYASGTALDLLLPLQSLTREGATHSTVALTLAGTPGAVLPSAPQAMDDAGYIWACQTAGITLDDSGTVTVEAICQTAGAISAAAGSIRRLVSPVAGLSAVVNKVAAVPGKDAETDASCRNRLRLAAASPSVSILEGMKSAILSLPYVQSCMVYENETDEEDERGIPGHSICVVVNRGMTSDIAPTIFRKKAPGIGTYGNISSEVEDAFGEKHTIRFQRATISPVSLAVQLKPLAGFDSAITEDIRAALAEATSSLEIGQDLIVPSLYGVVYGVDTSAMPTFSISLMTATVNGESTGGVLSAKWNQVFTVFDSMIQVIVEE